MTPTDYIHAIKEIPDAEKTTMLMALYLRTVLGGVYQRDMETLINAAKNADTK